MDRMLYLSMSAAQNTMLAQTVNNNNLANASTVGFRADLSQFRSMPVFGPGHASRVFAMEESPGIDFKPGTVMQTGNEMDVAIDGEGWIAVMTAEGAEAYTRAGDFHLDQNGLLMNGAGHQIMGNSGPIAIPPADTIEIAADGTISIRPIGQDEKTLATVDRIKLVNPPSENLFKAEDGLIRNKNGGVAVPDAGVKLVSGSLESSNVNMVESLVEMIALARRFEMNVKAMKTVEKNDETATRLLQMR